MSRLRKLSKKIVLCMSKKIAVVVCKVACKSSGVVHLSELRFVKCRQESRREVSSRIVSKELLHSCIMILVHITILCLKLAQTSCIAHTGAVTGKGVFMSEEKPLKRLGFFKLRELCVITHN